MALTSVRGLRKYYSSDTIILSALLAGTLMPVALMIASEFIDAPALSFMLSKFKIPNAQGWLFAVLLGLLGLFYQTYVTKAYAATRKAGIVATISYTDIIFSTLFGLLLGDALPGFMALVGMALIIAAGALVANRK